MANQSEPIDPEIVEGEIVEDETEDEEDENTISITGFNENAVVTPVECSDCGEGFFIKPDTIESINHCPFCGTEFNSYRTEF